MNDNTVSANTTEEKSITHAPQSVVVNPKELQSYIEHEQEIRKILTEYISQELKPGIDYGTIKFHTKYGDKESKPSLFKPGSEKFCAIMHLRPTFRKDEDTWEMSGREQGLFCYLCELVNEKGIVVGEGRGAANIREKENWLANNAIKISQKRAQVDAVIRTGQLSDFFTQDVEDMNLNEDTSAGNGVAQVQRPVPQKSMTESQKTFQKYYTNLSNIADREMANEQIEQIGRETTLSEKQKKFLTDLTNKSLPNAENDIAPF